MKDDFSWLPEATKTDSRYSPAAYEFLFEALEFTRDQLTEQRKTKIKHVSGAQLLEGFRSLALQKFGLMAKTVFNTWGVNSTSDVGEMVFRLVDCGDLEKTEDDNRSDFDDVYEFDEAFCRGYRIELE